MTSEHPPPPNSAPQGVLPDWLEGGFWNLAANGWMPARWIERNLPDPGKRAAKTGNLRIEIVSHCWNYAHLLVFQLSSLVLFPPERAKITMTVYYADEDEVTARTLAAFSEHDHPNLDWNWRPIPKTELFRRSIGRNEAALMTDADWVWFTDCDLLFRQGCMDALVAQLQGRNDILVYPGMEHRTSLLDDDDPLLNADVATPQVLDIDESRFHASHNTRATGPFQITHGDVARAVGYCNAIRYYQRPQPSFAKCREDRAFRWLLGTEGVSVDVPGVYRIRHASKGRYSGSGLRTNVRKWLRREKTTPPGAD